MRENKKILFILPHQVVKDHIIKLLSEKEYEIYSITNLKNLNLIVQTYPDSILYINIDSSLSENEWINVLKDLFKSFPNLNIGLLTGRVIDKKMTDTYVMDIGINCGIIQLRQGVKECSRDMLRVLDANEVKGRRRYLRYRCATNDNINLNFEYLNKKYVGQIIDISSVGLSCYFINGPTLSKHELLNDVQLKLSGILLTLNCVFMGSRNDDGTTIFLLIFSIPVGIDSQRSKIRKFIYNSLQKDMDSQFSA